MEPRIIGEMKPLRHFILLAGCLPMLATLAPAVAQDRMVLGVELGTRFLVSACNPGETAFPSRLCFNGALKTRKAWGADEYYVFVPNAGTPPYVRGEIRVSVINGIVESVQIGTWGIQAQGIALEALTKKYGVPTRARQEKQNTLRSRFPTQFAEWELKDFSVKLDGTTGSIDWGRIDFSTHRYRKLIGDYEKQPPAKPPK
ncbi:MAG: hypothetical protein AABZ67_02950 [Pseudomonadota bacterium]